MSMKSPPQITIINYTVQNKN